MAGEKVTCEHDEPSDVEIPPDRITFRCVKEFGASKKCLLHFTPI